MPQASILGLKTWEPAKPEPARNEPSIVSALRLLRPRFQSQSGRRFLLNLSGPVCLTNAPLVLEPLNAIDAARSIFRFWIEFLIFQKGDEGLVGNFGLLRDDIDLLAL